MGKRLSDLLIADGVVDEATMNEALGRKSHMGGRLGNHLLWIGAVDGATLEKYLTKAHGLPATTPGLLETIDDAVLRLLSVDDVVNFGVIPAAIEHDSLIVLVTDPLSEGENELLSRRTGRKLVPFILPEFRFQQALSELYGLPLPPRAATLVKRHPRKIGTLGFTGAFEAIPDDSVQDPAENLGAGWSVEQLSEFVGKSSDRDEIIAALLGFVGNFLPQRFVLVVHRGQLRGFAAQGIAKYTMAVRLITLERKLVWDAFESQPPHRGLVVPPHWLGLAAFYHALELSPPQELLCSMIRVAARPAMLLVADNQSELLPAAALPRIDMAVLSVSLALLSLVELNKGASAAASVSGPGLKGVSPIRCRGPIALPSRFSANARSRAPRQHPSFMCPISSRDPRSAARQVRTRTPVIMRWRPSSNG
jgi:hypothetical protein